MKIILDMPDNTVCAIVSYITNNYKSLGLNMHLIDTDLMHDGAVINISADRQRQKVKQGKWEYVGTDKISDVFKCSNCALTIGLQNVTAYCPNCGAKMDGEGRGK